MQASAEITGKQFQLQEQKQDRFFGAKPINQSAPDKSFNYVGLYNS